MQQAQQPNYRKPVAPAVSKDEFRRLVERVEALEEANKPKRGRPPKDKQDGDNDANAS
jgi:hypothetical protein